MHFYMFDFMPFYKFDLMPFYKFDIMCDSQACSDVSVLKVLPYVCFTISTLCLFYKFHFMSVLQVRPYVCFTSSILCLFY